MEYYSLFDGNYEELQDGDLVFRKGLGTASQLINLADNKTVYSHVGIIYEDSVHGWMVIHMVPGEERETDGIEIIKNEALNMFFCSDRSSTGALYRLNMDNSQRVKIVSKAREWSKRGILFDHNFNMNDSTKMYCTEFIFKIFQEADIDITEGRRHYIVGFRHELILPSDILQNENLVKIYSFKK